MTTELDTLSPPYIPEAAPGSGGPTPGMGRLVVALIVSQLGLHAAMAGQRMAAPLDALRTGASPWAVGVLMALFAAAPMVLALWAGRLADRWGFHRPMRLAAGVAISGLLLAAASTLVAGVPRAVLLGLGALATGAAANIGVIAILRTGGLMARDPVERLRVFSWLAIAPSFANVVGPVAAGVLIDQAGFGATYLALLVLPLSTLLATRAVPASTAAPTPPSGPQRAWDLLALPGLKRLLLVNWLLSMCWDVHAFAVPILGHEHGFSATTIGLVLGSFTLSVTGVRLLIPVIARHLREVTVVQSSMLGTALIFAVYPWASTPWTMGACSVLLGVTLGCVQPMMMSVLHHLTPADRHGQALAFRSMTINAASTFMPLVFGAAGAALGAAAMFWAVAAMVSLGSTVARGMTAPRH